MSSLLNIHQRTSEEDLSLLLVVLDVAPVDWIKRGQLSRTDEKDKFHLFIKVIDDLLVFLTCFLALNYGNQCVLVTANSNQSDIAFSTYENKSQIISTASTNKHPLFSHLHQSLIDLFLSQCDKMNQTGPCNLASGLALSLCYINRITKIDPSKQYRPRILTITASEDSSKQYIAIMNCIFSAQKLAIPVDSCVMRVNDSVYLQQAASMTHGLYAKVDHLEDFGAYLMTIFLPDRDSRKHLHMKSLDKVDFRGSCFCHRQLIDIGFVCSVCLSIFCRFIPVCTTCKAKFSFTPPLPLAKLTQKPAL